ncbi:MAG TPA: adenylate/guanylate cyclase domain-containing protein [Candidatus Limnocylindria bacterium]|nr:adenylate/guanylate cyclase domain-containing protein [Candidatus Limnocylindria bacterium]
MTASPPRPRVALDPPPPDTHITVTAANVLGAAAVYLYFTYLDPVSGIAPDPIAFLVVVGGFALASWRISEQLFGPAVDWYERLRRGADAQAVPVGVRRRALNAPLISAALTLGTWTLAGIFFALRQRWRSPELPVANEIRLFLGIVLVGGVTTAAMTFLISEFTWRRRIPAFFPYGELDREGVLRLPIVVRLGATFMLTALVPLVVLLALVTGVGERMSGLLPVDLQPLWGRFVWAHVYVVLVNAGAATVMALLVARFINRPIQALRLAMTRVEAGDFAVRVPVRSLDELGELNQHFNSMVAELERGVRSRELFGRYVSPEVAQAALERNVELESQVVLATAMFVDLRGFTELSRRLPPEQIVEMLGDYYAVVEAECEREQGTITQFLGDGVVVVFGGPLLPAPDHAVRAVRAAVAVQRVLRERRRPDGEPLEAGIGLCTGYMIAGNVRGRSRVIYTIVGDAVNQAARLQVKTRELGRRVLLTESTRAALPDPPPVTLTPCGKVALRGILEDVEVYAVDV